MKHIYSLKKRERETQSYSKIKCLEKNGLSFRKSSLILRNIDHHKEPYWERKIHSMQVEPKYMSYGNGVPSHIRSVCPKRERVSFPDE